MKTLINLTKKVKAANKHFTPEQKINFVIDSLGLIEHQKSKGIPNHFNN